MKDNTPPLDTYPPKVTLPKLGIVSGIIYIDRGIIAEDYGILPKGSANGKEGQLGRPAPWDKMELYIDGKLAPIEYNPFTLMSSGAGEYRLVTYNLLNGKHTLSVKVYDKAGNIGEDSIEIEVKN